MLREIKTGYYKKNLIITGYSVLLILVQREAASCIIETIAYDRTIELPILAPRPLPIAI